MPRARTAALLVAALGGALVAPALARPVSELTVLVSPAKGGTKAKPKLTKLTLVLKTRTDNPAEPAPTTTKAEIFLPSEFVIGARDFQSCTAAILNDGNDRTQCRPRSKVGSGRATAVAGTITETLAVTVYNGPKGKSVLLHLKGDSPVPIDQALEGKLIKAGEAGYGSKLVINVPAELQEIAGLRIALTELGATIRAVTTRRVKGHRVKAPYIGIGPCKDRSLAFKVVSFYRGIAEPGVGEGTVGCS